MRVLLEIDGTILDLAPSPQQVWVPTGLDTLTGKRLGARLRPLATAMRLSRSWEDRYWRG